MLYKLISRSDRKSFEPQVITLIRGGPFDQKIQALGVPVLTLGMQRGVPNPFALSRLTSWIRRDQPLVIQTWLHHADLIGGLAAKLAGGIPVMWGIRHSDLDPQIEKRSAIWTAKTCARLSPWLPQKIVCCSEAARRVHIQMGYAINKMLVIPNGFDLNVFKPDPAARNSVRRELGIDQTAPIIGLVARFHPQKDHRNFIEAAAMFHAHMPESHFLLCGRDVTPENTELNDWIEAVGLKGKCHLLGDREDIPRLTAALDIASLSASSGEAFPTVVGEAMACGIPCVVTNVGDSAMIVGDTGRVVPPRDPHALADGWRSLLVDMGQEERTRMGSAARRRIGDRYGLANIVEQYEALYSSVAELAGTSASD